MDGRHVRLARSLTSLRKAAYMGSMYHNAKSETTVNKRVAVNSFASTCPVTSHTEAMTAVKAFHQLSCDGTCLFHAIASKRLRQICHAMSERRMGYFLSMARS